MLLLAGKSYKIDRKKYNPLDIHYKKLLKIYSKKPQIKQKKNMKSAKSLKKNQRLSQEQSLFKKIEVKNEQKLLKKKIDRIKKRPWSSQYDNLKYKKKVNFKQKKRNNLRENNENYKRLRQMHFTLLKQRSCYHKEHMLDQYKQAQNYPINKKRPKSLYCKKTKPEKKFFELRKQNKNLKYFFIQIGNSKNNNQFKQMIFVKWQKLFEQISFIQKLKNSGEEFKIIEQFNEYIMNNIDSYNVRKLLITLSHCYQQIFQKFLKLFPNNLNIFVIFSNWAQIIFQKQSKDICLNILLMLQNILAMSQQQTNQYYEIFGLISIRAGIVLLENFQYKKSLLIITNFNQEFRQYYQKFKDKNEFIISNTGLMAKFIKSFLIIILCLLKIDKQKNFQIINNILKKSKNIIQNMIKNNSLQQDDELIQFYQHVEGQMNYSQTSLKSYSKNNIAQSIQQIIKNSIQDTKKRDLKYLINSPLKSQTYMTQKSRRTSSKQSSYYRIQNYKSQKDHSFKKTLNRKNCIEIKLDNKKQNEQLMKQILKELEYAKIDRQKIMEDQKLILKKIQPYMTLNQKVQSSPIYSNIEIQLYMKKPKIQESILFQCYANQIQQEKKLLTFIIPLKTQLKKYQICFQINQEKKKKFNLQIFMKEDENIQSCFTLNLQQISAILKYCNVDILATFKEPLSQIDTFIEFITKILVYHIKIEREIIRDNQQKFSTSLNIFPCFPYQIVVEDYVLSKSKLIETLLNNNTYKMTYLDPITHTVQMTTFLIDNYDNFLNKEYHSTEDINIIDQNYLYNNCGKYINLDYLSQYQEKKIEYIKQQYEAYFQTKIDKIKESLKFKNKQKNIVALFLRNSKKNYEFFVFNEIKSKDQLIIYQSYFQKDKFYTEQFQIAKISLIFLEALFKINFEQIYKIDKYFFYFLIYSCSNQNENQRFLSEDKLEDIVKSYKGQFNFKKYCNIDYYIIEGPNFVLLSASLQIYKFKQDHTLYFYSSELSQEQKSFYLQNLCDQEILAKIFSLLYYQDENETIPQNPSIFNDSKVRFISLERFTKLMQ